MTRGTGGARTVMRTRNGLGLNGNLTARARAVVRAFFQARKIATGFLLSCGVFPEVNESSSERLHGIVHNLASQHLDRNHLVRALRASLRQSVRSRESLDRIDRDLTALLACETTAAYVFGLAAGLGISTLDERLKR